ncbi:MAG TPA: hypothetical protein VMN57_01320 [Anaerolineales bacterium]|nr:hypothetical protein [Anaerolineales bacterium]
MRKKVILITGAAGEVGRSQIQHLAETDGTPLLTIDIRELAAEIEGMSTHLVDDILDNDLFAHLIADYEFDQALTLGPPAPRPAAENVE